MDTSPQSSSSSSSSPSSSSSARLRIIMAQNSWKSSTMTSACRKSAYDGSCWRRACSGCRVESTRGGSDQELTWGGEAAREYCNKRGGSEEMLTWGGEAAREYCN
eukprot:1431118-Pyramimonas_sp.AAC.1